MFNVPHQRERLGWSVTITVPDDAPTTARRAAQAFIHAAVDRPGPLRAVLERRSVFGEETSFVSPQRIITEAVLVPLDDRERIQALDVLSRLFLTGGDRLLTYDPQTQKVVTAAAEIAVNPDIARTQGLHAALGCLAASLDGQIVPPYLPKPHEPFAP